MVEKIPSWIERLLLPKLSEISGEIKALSARIDSLEKTTNERINSLEKMLDERITSLRNEMIVKFDSIEKRMPLIEKIMELEARLARLEGKA